MDTVGHRLEMWLEDKLCVVFFFLTLYNACTSSDGFVVVTFLSPGVCSKLPLCFVSCGDHENRKFTLRRNLHLSYDVMRNTSVRFYSSPHGLMVLQHLQESF